MFLATLGASSKLLGGSVLQRGLSSMSSSLKILYRTLDCVVVDKPADVAINSWDKERHPITVASLLEELMPESADPSVSYKFRFAHRLDFSTSGVLCIALNRKTAASFAEAFEKRNTDKTYIALLIGHLKDELTVDMPIGEDRRASHKMLPKSDPDCIEDTARSATTRFTPIQYGTFRNVSVTKVQIKLFTGRRHQIRIHALTIGHPVLGDTTYTGDTETPRMYLHSKRLRIPYGDGTIDVESPIDFELDTVIQQYTSTSTDSTDPS